MSAEDDMRLGRPVPGWEPPPRPEHAAMEGRYCRLEPVAAAHAGELHAAFRVDDGLWDYMLSGPYGSVAEYGARLAEMAGSRDPLFFAIRNRGSGRAEGVASFLRIAPEAGSIEVGHITLSPALQRTRAATEAMFLMMGWAFGAGYRRYEWKCNALNRASRRAAERLGFSFEGVFRNALVARGRNRDTAWFAATDDDWPALRVAFTRWLDPANFDAGGRQLRRLSEMTRPVLVARDPTGGGR